MKQILFLIAFSAAYLLSTAQKDFTGTITYKVHTPQGFGGSNDEDKDMMIRFVFAPGKILFSSTEKEINTHSILFLDSGLHYELNDGTKTYTVKKMKELKLPASIPSEPKIFGGYKASPSTMTSQNLPASYLFRMGITVFYLADSLTYTIPEKFYPNEELLMVQQNRIVLAGYLTIDAGQMGDWDEGDENTPDSVKPKDFVISIGAVSVEPGLVNAEELIIPSAYTLEPEYTWEDSVSEKEMMVPADTAVVLPPKPVAKKPAPKPAPQKKKTPAKSPANTRKQ